MNKKISPGIATALLLLTATFSFSNVASTQMGTTDAHAQFARVNTDSVELVIGVKENRYPELMDLIARSDTELINTILVGEKIAAIVVDVSLLSVSRLVTAVSGLSKYVEPNMKYTTNIAPNDEYWDEQWNLGIIKADWAWNTTMGSDSVLVAVVDSGIDYNHPELADNYVPLGYDWVNNDTDPMDDRGHGTHCAGIIAAVTNNSEGIAGIAQVSIMAEKGLDSEGFGETDQLVQAIIHAVDQGVDIISLSWGGYKYSELMHEAVKYAYDHGVLVVASSGNYPTTLGHYPAAYEEVVAVSATYPDDGWASFSGFGEWIEVSAPGLKVYSTVCENHTSYPYGFMSGTSQAAPHVAGVAALILSRFPELSFEQLRTKLWYSTDDLGDPGFDIYYGYGRINARKAVEEAIPEHDLIITGWKTPPYVEPGNDETIGVTVFNYGQKDEWNIDVQLLANNTLVDSAKIYFLASLKSVTVDLSWSPVLEGGYNVTAYVVPASKEAQLFCNKRETSIYVGFPIKAAVVNSYGTDSPIIDQYRFINSNWKWYGDEFVHIDYTTLNKENITYNDLAASNADVLLISCAYVWEFSDSEIEAIIRYVHEGLGLIATAGTLCYTAPNNNKLAPLFGLSESIVWEAEYGVSSLELLEPDHPLFFDIPNTLNFEITSGAVPTDGKWSWNENAGGTYVALGPKKKTAIVTYKGLVYISPFLEGRYPDEPRYSHVLQLFYNAIVWSRYQKQERDLQALLECPTYLRSEKEAELNITVSNLGLQNETDLDVHLMVNGSLVENRTIAKLHANSSMTFTYTWTAPSVESFYNMSVYVHPTINETYIEDNINTKFLRVTNMPAIGMIGMSIKDYLPDYCEELGYVVEGICEDLTADLLDKYDVIVVGATYPKWSDSEIEVVKNYIDSGGSFLAIGDYLPECVQLVLENYGISYTGTGAANDYTSNFDSEHPIMQGVDQVYVTPWPPWAEVTRNSLEVVPPAYWIANDTSNEHIVIAGVEVNGTVLCLCSNFYDYTWKNERMFENIFEWMTAEPLETDLNKDGIVNIMDLSIVAYSFGSKEGDENYNLLADMDDNKQINIIDISTVAMDYGQTI